MSCFTTVTPPGWQGPADGVPCCWATMAGDDWDACTCWVPIYDPPEQAPMLPGEPSVMPAMCEDCAYRPGSPERAGNPDAAADGYDLDDFAISGTQFWCHDGLRRVIAMRHSGTGEVVTFKGQHHYDPPLDGRQRPHRTDGAVGSLCAGWDARRKAWASTPADRDLPTLAHASASWEAP